MNNKKNIISAIILQIITMISGLILPRLILSTFNSEVNGLVASITQFLSFISLVEGGLGAVVLAELYKPINQNDEKKIYSILLECQNYFGKISLIYIIYTLVLAVIYPFICNSTLSFEYISTLTIILSFSTLIQYMFSITYKLYLQANQKVYIVNYCSVVISVVNLLLVYLVILFIPSIHIVKLVTGILFLIQPIIFNRFVEKKYHVKFKIKKCNKSVLKDRWSGFAQHISYFINMNTDITVITLLIGLKEVSVYSVYMLALAALRNFISLISNTYQSALGKYNASGDIKLLRNKFIKLQKINWIISLVFYSTCYLLISSFVSLYTKGVNDTNYFQPVFSAFIILATLLYSICEPQRFLVLAVGQFKDIKLIYIFEACINIVVSVILAFQLGLVGVAIGTLAGISVRFICFVIYLRNNIVFLKIKEYIPLFIFTILFIIFNVFVSLLWKIQAQNFVQFILYGAIIFAIEFLLGFTFYISSEKLSYMFEKNN